MPKTTKDTTRRRAPARPGQLVEGLRRSGRRVTPQRVMILEAMQAARGHVTADELVRRVQASHPYVNRSTVYRTLDMLVREGVVSVTDFGNSCAQYEITHASPHHHLVCQGCGAVGEFDHALFAPLQTALKAQFQFEANIHHFAVFGLCKHCNAARPAAPKKSRKGG